MKFELASGFGATTPGIHAGQILNVRCGPGARAAGAPSLTGELDISSTARVMYDYLAARPPRCGIDMTATHQ